MQFTLSQHSAGNPDRLFHLASNFTELPKHLPAITNLELLTPLPIGVGTKFKETRMMFGKAATETFEVTAWEPGKSFTMQANSCGMLYIVEHNFHPQPGGGTLIELKMSAKSLTLFAKLMAPMGWLMKGFMKKAIAKDLAALAQAGEGPEPTELAKAA